MSNPVGPSRPVLAGTGKTASVLAGGEKPAETHQRIVATARRPRDYLLRRALATADMLAVLVACTITLILGSPAPEPDDLVWLLPTLLVWVVIFRLYGLYERDVKRISASALDDLPSLFHAFVLGTLLLALYVSLLQGQAVALTDAVTFGVCGVLLASVFRLVARRGTLRFGGPSRVLLVGGSAVGEILVRKIRSHPEYGLEPVGEVSLNGQRRAASDLPCLGRLEDIELRHLAKRHDIERVIVMAQDLPDEVMMDLIHDCAAAQVKVSVVPSHFEALGPSVAVDNIEGLTILGLNPLVLSRSSRVLKRSLDLVGACVGLVLAAPVLALFAAAISLGSEGPVLFRQRRIGRGGEPFTLLKFRTMVVDAEARAAELRSLSDDPDWLKLDRDPRVTPIGRFLRATSLDELPQLWNVLTGEMSLVGPRPLIGEEDELIAGWSRSRLDLAPGVTGLWQVLGRTEIPFRDMLSLDYLYVTNWSLWLDIKLIVRTVPAVLMQRGAN